MLKGVLYFGLRLKYEHHCSLHIFILCFEVEGSGSLEDDDGGGRRHINDCEVVCGGADIMNPACFIAPSLTERPEWLNTI